MTVRFVDKSTECDTIYVSAVSTQHCYQQVVEDSVPMTQDESMHAPTIDGQCCHHRVELQQSGDTCAPRAREEVAHAPKSKTFEAHSGGEDDIEASEVTPDEEYGDWATKYGENGNLAFALAEYVHEQEDFGEQLTEAQIML